MSTPHRPPTSARHAFALAFDLAVRRDALQSLVVPLLLHAPWLVLQAVVPSPEEPGGFVAGNLMLSSVILLGDFVVSLLVAAMLRFRARSMYEAGPSRRPDPALQCYARGARRLPWLFAAELLRNVAIFCGGLFLLLPGIWVGFRFSLATEAVVLGRTGVIGAFGRSYQLTEARLERWLEMIAFSVVMVLCVLFSCALGFLTFQSSSWSTWATVALFLLSLVMSVIQYAWTFFYLDLEDLDAAAGPGESGEAAGPGAARVAGERPRLTVVEGGRRQGDAGG